MFYGIQVETALAMLGISLKVFDRGARKSLISVAKQDGLTHQEAAWVMACMLPVAYRIDLEQQTLVKWLIEGKIKISKPQVYRAFSQSGLHPSVWDRADYR